MLCAISGEAPEEPVVSKKTGTVFEKRLIEKYIQENGKEPVTGEELDPEDLLPIKSARVVRPRPPTLTSIPALLSTFQNEWDSLALETYNLREQLTRTREELATALYQHDAAVRVVARLTRERDEAREALSNVAVSASVTTSSDPMAVDDEPLPQDLAEHVDAVHQRLSKSRKKRPVPQGWATPNEVSSLSAAVTGKEQLLEPSSLVVGGDKAVVGSRRGDVSVRALDTGALDRTLQIGEPVSDVLWSQDKIVVATSKGSIGVFSGGAEPTTFQGHAGLASGLALHPGGEMFASVGPDKTFVFYDLHKGAKVFRAHTDSILTVCAFHPDGHLFAAGTDDGNIKIYTTKTGEEAAVFHLGASVRAISFSENGFWFAASGKGQPTVTIFDLRKEGEAAKVKELATGEALSLSWDFSGRYLATAGPSGVTVQQYLKGSKAWSEPLRNSEPSVLVAWGSEAKSLVTVGSDGTFSVLGVQE